MVYWLDTSIEEHLVELINLAQTQLDGAEKVGHWFKMRELASNHGLLKNFFKDILAQTHVVSFDFEGNRLLCGAGDQRKVIELWILDSTNQLFLAWSCELARPICHLKYSPDSTLFCSAGKNDKLVKVWFEANKSYTFMYLKHPAPVTSLEWRRTGRFTPHGLIANVLMTSCQDNRVRLWVQTSLPDLVDYKLIPHFHLAATIEDKSSPALVTHWINNKEMHMTRSLETLLQDMLARILKDNEQVSTSTTPTTNDLELEIEATDDTLTAESSKKLRHKLCRKINKQRALAASGRSSSSKDQNCNSSSANLTRSNMTGSNGGSTGDLNTNVNNNGSANNQGTTSPTGGGSSTSLADEFDKTLDCLLRDWRNTTDLLFSINKTDGTITSWQIKHLDGEESGASRQVQVETYSCLSSALPIHDATTMSDVTAFSPNVTTEKSNIFIVTQHVSGTLSLWRLNLEQGVDQLTRISGLPISPEWLRDGILTVKFDDEANHLITDWIAISTKSQPDITEQHEPFVGPMDYYKASELATELKLLPQYHLKQLVDLLAFGKLQRIKAVLNHLVNCLAPTDKQHQKKRAHRSRTFSITTQSAPSFQDSLDLDGRGSLLHQGSVEEIELDYDEVLSIEPLTLHLLLQADTQVSKSVDGKQHHAHEEFSSSIETFKYFKSTVDETLDEILGKSTLETINSQKEMNRLASEEPEEDSLTSFNPKKAKLLTRVLTHAHLPGLTNVDQMHLLALADAVAFFDASPDDIIDVHDEDGGASGQGSGPSMISTIDSLDDRGLRFVTAMRQYVYLTKCLPMNQRNELRSAGIGTDNIVWAFHSETQDELIGLIPCLQRNKPEWSELKEFGIGWWLRKLDVLKKIIEKVAQAAYQSKQDPLDAALFYLAMKKKTLVCALLRRTNCDKRLLKLFEQDFNDPVNRKKALKNAYALLGLHRFEHAAAFFLLAGSIWDAIEVCINNLNDIQLAMVLIRLHDNDSDVPGNLKRLLISEILGTTKGDPFLKSMAHWKLGDYVSATHILLEGDMSNASTFNFYRFLKEQPLVIKHLVNKYSDEAVAENERRLFFATAQSYMKSGCPLLAIEVLSSQDHLNVGQAQRMKFICCLHVLLNELNTLNANFEDWFERNIEACSSICAFPQSREYILRIMLTYSSLQQLHEVRSAILNML